MIFLFFWFYEFWKNFRVSHFKKYPWLRVENLSRFDDLEFPKTKNFAKMTEKRETPEKPESFATSAYDIKKKERKKDILNTVDSL